MGERTRSLPGAAQEEAEAEEEEEEEVRGRRPRSPI